jgi:hypothetical protein
MSWGCYYWYRFVAERSGRYSRLGKTAKVLLALPTAAISVMLICVGIYRMDVLLRRTQPLP